jgi:hypothetical protein
MVEANISVPTVELMNEGGDEFHTYTIQIDAADGTWTIHKRCVLAALVSGTARVMCDTRADTLTILQIARCGCRLLTVLCTACSVANHTTLPRCGQGAERTCSSKTTEIEVE